MISLLYAGGLSAKNYHNTHHINDDEKVKAYNAAAEAFISHYGVRITRGEYKGELSICVENPAETFKYPKEYMGFRVGVKRLKE